MEIPSGTMTLADGYPVRTNAFSGFMDYQRWCWRRARTYPSPIGRVGIHLLGPIAGAVGYVYYRFGVIYWHYYVLWGLVPKARLAYSTFRYWLALGKLYRRAVVWWWGERPGLRELHHHLLVAVREGEAKVAAEQAAATTEAERLRAERLDYVLRWMFGAVEMTPDDIGPQHLEN